ncbi:type I secretion system permease/ATPase [Rhodobacteraceae bacterium]|nr:type I secretion system permease/ATPase [Paracoccaceae bacterium]
MNASPETAAHSGRKETNELLEAGIQTQTLENEKLDQEIIENSGRDTLLQALQAFLSLDGMAFSIGALRDMGDLSEVDFSPKSAVDALNQLDYKSSLGQLKPKRFKQSHCPLIAFTKSDDAVLVEFVEENGTFNVTYFSQPIERKNFKKSELRSQLNEYVILAQKDILKQSSESSWFWGSFSQSKWLYFQVALASMLTNIFALSAGLFIMVVYDRVVPNEATESLLVLTIGVVLVLGFDFVIKSLKGQFIDRAGQRADNRMARLIFNRILNLKLDKRSQRSGAMASIVKEFDTLKEFFTSATLVAVVDLPFIFFFIWVLTLISGPLAYVPLVTVFIIIFAALIIQPLLAMTAKASLQTNMSKQSVLIETLNGLETVRATGSGRLMRKRFENASNIQSELAVKNRVYANFAINLASSALQYNMVATVFFGVFLLQNGTVTMGSLIATVIIGGRALAPVSQIAAALTRAHSARQAYLSLSTLMKKDNEAGSSHAKLSRPHFEGTVEIQKLSYEFPRSNLPIINDLSFKIPKGQKVAIIGRMGSGKSTLARLLSGLVSPTSGSLLIDGIDARQVDPSDLRRNIGVMLQETWLFSGTVKENIQMGFFEHSDQQLLEICKVSGVDDFISKHPSGYDLELKERGDGLSGGQKQSINLARALLHSPKVLILDEPTSSMDQATEAAVVNRLKLWAVDKTVIMITHRNSLLSLADRVIVMDGGQILKDTTPEMLRAEQMARG